MNLFFDEDSQKIIINAKEEMYQLKHPYVGSEHLLLSILKNDDLEITKILRKYNISYDNFRNKLIESVGIGKKSNSWFLFTPMLKKILIDASNQSKNEYDLVTPYCLFITILQEGDGVANRILSSMNVDLSALYQIFLTNSMLFKNQSFDVLNQYAINMNHQSKKYDPVIGRDKKIHGIIRVLLRKNKNNPLLIGDAGVGKTALVEELARMISVGNVPTRLQKAVIYSLSMSSLISGTKYRGEFEERFQKILDEVKNQSDIILFIDEFHTMIGAGGAEGAIDASNIIKPYLARGEVKMIGATTLEEYSKWIAKDKAFDRRFQKIFVDEVKENEVNNILFQLKPIYEQYHHVSISDSILERIISYSYQYIFYGKQPDKSIDFLDEVCVYVSSKNHSSLNKYHEYQTKIKDIVLKKNQYILEHDFTSADKYRKKEKKLRLYLQEAFMNHFDNSSFFPVLEEDLDFVLYDKTHIPIHSIFNEMIDKTFFYLKKYIIGQNKPISDIYHYLKKSVYLHNNRPIPLLIVGNSGVGKTFFAHKFSETLIKDDNYYSFSLKNYSSKEDFFCSLEKKIDYSIFQKRPFAVITIDDIDYGDYSILLAIINLIESGSYFSDKGNHYNFSHCIFLLLSQKKISSIGFIGADMKPVLSDLFFSKIPFVCHFRNLSSISIQKYISNYCTFNHYNQINVDSLYFYVMSHHNYKKNGFHGVDHLIEEYLFTTVKS